jgi:hypothetical protein
MPKPTHIDLIKPSGQVVTINLSIDHDATVGLLESVGCEITYVATWDTYLSEGPGGNRFVVTTSKR